MAKFWKHKLERPLVRNYNGWYYSVEIRGRTYTFIDIERLRDHRNSVAGGKLRTRHSRPIWSRSGLGMRMHRLQESYFNFRHRKEIVIIFDQAYEYFSAEENKNERFS